MSLDAFIKGWAGELKTKITQGLFLDSSKYHTINNVLVPKTQGSTQIDHVIVSQYGIFCVETKDKSHWIYGSEKEPQWTQVIFQEKHRFQNPLHQNYGHARSLAEYLGLKHEVFHSLIVFWGGVTFKTPMPNNVVDNFLAFIGYIKSKKEILLSQDQVEAAVERLNDLKNSTSSNDHRAHVRELKESHCPKCGGLLVEKVAKNGPHTGNKFLGCSKFPKCHFTRPIP